MEFPVPLRNLQIPPELLREVETYRKGTRARTERDRVRLEENLRLSIYFGGGHVVCIPTSEGRVVLAAGQPGTGTLREALEQLSPEDRAKVRVETPNRWEEMSIPAETSLPSRG